MKYYEKIPRLVLCSINNYVRKGIRPGDFVKSVICNDLLSCIEYSDPESCLKIKDIMMYMRWNVPSACWGNTNAFQNWMNVGGIDGASKNGFNYELSLFDLE